MIRLIGLDLSLTSPGLAWTAGPIGRQRLGVRTVRTQLSGPARVNEILGAIGRVIDEQRPPQLAVIESPFVNMNAGATLALAKLHGVVEQWLWARNIPWLHIVNTKLKIYATGRGDADKADVLHAARNQWGHLVGGPAEIDSTDAADALTLLCLGLHAIGQPPAALPASHTRAVDGLRGKLPDRLLRELILR